MPLLHRFICSTTNGVDAPAGSAGTEEASTTIAAVVATPSRPLTRHRERALATDMLHPSAIVPSVLDRRWLQAYTSRDVTNASGGVEDPPAGSAQPSRQYQRVRVKAEVDLREPV